MNNSDTILACLYCGDTMDMPTDELIERVGRQGLICCEYEMAPVDRSNLYRLLKGLDKLKENIEQEILKGFKC